MFLRFARRAVVCALVMAGTVQAQVPPLDPDSPLAPLADLGVEWPDLDVRDPLEGEAAIETAATTDVAGEQRYSVVIEGVEANLRGRFDALSVLKEGEGKPANVAQIDRRARDDAELLDQLLRADGYYDAEIETAVVPGAERLAVTLTVTPGPLYKFESVQLPGLAAAGDKAVGMRDALGVDTGDAVDADTVIAGQAALAGKLGSEGFPFAKVPEPEVVIDHETRTATLTLPVQTGGERKFGAIRLQGGRPPFGPEHIQTIARFRPGETYDQAMIDDLRRALIATGLISTVRLEPVEGAVPGTVDIATTLERAPARTVAGEAGYGTGEGFRVEASWTHRNLIKPEGAVTFRGVAGTREQSLGALLRMSNFRRRDQILNARVIAANENEVAYDARTFEIGASIERQTNIIWQKKWTYSFGAELLASDERDFITGTGVEQRRTFFIGALPATLGYDGSDDLLDPTRGYRLSGRVSPELSLQGRAFGYVRAQIDASRYFPVSDRLVIAGRTRLGATGGASRASIAPSRLFYSGGGGSVRGYGYQEIGPRNVFDDPIGGRSLAEFSLEARVRFGNFGIVPFVDAGNIYTSTVPDFSGLRIGAGVGARYYSNFGPIRIDVGTPLNRRSGDPRIAV